MIYGSIDCSPILHGVSGREPTKPIYKVLYIVVEAKNNLQHGAPISSIRLFSKANPEKRDDHTGTCRAGAQRSALSAQQLKQ